VNVAIEIGLLLLEPGKNWLKIPKFQNKQQILFGSAPYSGRRNQHYNYNYNYYIVVIFCWLFPQC